MSALSKILPLLTSREARRTTTERPTNVLSATVPPVCSSAADRADHASPPPSFPFEIAPPFLPFCEQEISWCAYELVRAPRRNYRRRWRPSRRPVRPRSTRRAYRRRLRRRSSSSRRARPPRDPKRQPHSIAVRNPSASPMREPEALHTSPMSPSPAICVPKAFSVLPTPYTLPLKAIAVLSTSFSPLEQS